MHPALRHPNQIYKRKIHEKRQRQTPGSTVSGCEGAEEIGVQEARTSNNLFFLH